MVPYPRVIDAETKMTGFFKLITTVISSEMARQKRVQRRRMKILSDPSTYVVAN